jgi:hypothetical protein
MTAIEPPSASAPSEGAQGQGALGHKTKSQPRIHGVRLAFILFQSPDPKSHGFCLHSLAFLLIQPKKLLSFGIYDKNFTGLQEMFMYTTL